MGAGHFLGTANAVKPIVKLLLIVPILLWSSVSAADFRAGLEAYERGDYATAYKELLPLAEQGHAGAQFNLGAMYFNGEGVPEDYVRAFAWFNLAVAQGEENAKKAKGIIRRGMTAAQIAEAQELSISLLQRIETRASGSN